MLGDITVAENIYIACVYTDYPRSIIIREASRWFTVTGIFTKISNNDIYLILIVELFHDKEVCNYAETNEII